MTIDTSRTLEIAGSRSKLVGMLALSAALAVFGAYQAFLWDPGIVAGSFKHFLGIFLLVLGGSSFIVVIRRLLTHRVPIITLSPEGVRDTRLSAEVVPWSAVRNISTWGELGSTVIVLTIDPLIEARLRLPFIARWLTRLNRVFGVDGLCISSLGLKIGHSDLLSTIIAYSKDARREAVRA